MPGEVALDVDVRDSDAAARAAVVEGILVAARAVAGARGLGLEVVPIVEDAPVACADEVVAAVEAAAAAAGARARRMISGAYHDAMILGARVPIGMIFVPSAGGISHHPDEFTASGGPRPRRAGARRRAGEAGGMRQRLLAVARGDAEPDLVVAGARVFSAFTREWLEGDVAVADGRIAGIGALRRRRADRRPRAARSCPASSTRTCTSSRPSCSRRSSPAWSSRAGTTAVVCDPHEIANVLGAEGALWLLDAAEGSPLRVYAMAPSCVPAERAGVAARRARTRPTWRGSSSTSARSASPR